MNEVLNSQSALCIKQIELGPMQNFIYFLINKQTSEAVIVDPAWDVIRIKKILEENGLILKALLITHVHADHTNGIESILESYDIPVYVSKYEAEFYDKISENIVGVGVDFNLSLKNIEIEFLHTPGHTPGSQCFLVQGNLIAGDTLFLNGCGRCDLPGGNADAMYDTIYKKLMKLPEDTIIYPGHNYHTLKKDSLEQQKKNNPYMQFSNLHEFVRYRMGGQHKKS